MKKIFTLFILLLLLPVTALAEGTAPQTLYVGGTQIYQSGYWTSSDNGTTWNLQSNGQPADNYIHYDSDSATLTLKNATITGTNSSSASSGAGIYAVSSAGSDVALTIELEGTSTVSGVYGIYVQAKQDSGFEGKSASLTISGEGTLTAIGDSNHGIAVFGYNGGAALTIENATVTASTSGDNAAGVCVYSGSQASNSPEISLTVNGGSLTANSGTSSDGILFYVGSPSATNPTTSLTVSGNAIVDAKTGGIRATDPNTSDISDQIKVSSSGDGNNGGIVFNGKSGTVYGDVTLQENLEIGTDETLTIPEDASLTVPEDASLTVPDGTTLTTNGKIINSGTIIGTVTGKVAIPLTEDMITVADATYTGVAVTPDVTVVKDGVAYTKDTDYTVSYSDNTNAGMATVTVTPKEGSLLLGSAVEKKFTIAKADNEWTTALSMDGWTYGEDAKEPTAVAKFGTPIFTYSNEENGTYITEQPIKAGTWYVKATVEGTDNYTELCETKEFSIAKAAATLSFAEVTVSATIGETVENTLTVTPEGVTVSYSSSDEKVATVDASTGAITLVGTGETIITATISDPNYTGYPASYTLTVSKATLAGNEITAEGATNISIEKNGTPFKLTAQVTANDLGTGGKWEWTSDNETVATVAAEQGTLRAATSTSSATVTPLSVGTATITATYEDNKYVGSVTYTVTVTKPYVPDPISYYNIYVEDVCDGVEISTSKQVVREGGSITVYVEKDTANYTFDNFKVYYKRSYYDTWNELKEGVQPGEYPINNIWTHIYIKAEGAEEKEDPTGIESIEGVKVYTKDGSLYVQTPQREQVIIVSMSGAVVKNEEQIGLKQYHGLQPGIYIVRVGDRAYKLRLH